MEYIIVMSDEHILYSGLCRSDVVASSHTVTFNLEMQGGEGFVCKQE